MLAAFSSGESAIAAVMPLVGSTLGSSSSELGDMFSGVEALSVELAAAWKTINRLD